jgi:hypothetical protein
MSMNKTKNDKNGTYSRLSKAFTLNVANARHELPLIKEIAKKYQYELLNERKKRCDMVWLWPLTQTENYKAIMEKSSIFNRLPGLNYVSNKKHCALLFRRLLKNYGSEFDFVPYTFLLPTDKVLLQQAMKGPKNPTFIFKPESGAEGVGIFLS